MKSLLIRPEDGLLDGPWASMQWDRIIDLGRGGVVTYSQAGSHFNCPITVLDQIRDRYNEIYRARDLLRMGAGKFCDRFGLDWWELLSILIHHNLETAILLRKLAQTIGPEEQVYVSGPGFHRAALTAILNRPIKAFPAQQPSRGIGRYVRTVRKFPLPQVLEFFWDKVDAGYQFRGHFIRTRKTLAQKDSSRGIVLLPTSYINVSRTGIAYANILPERQFLLVTTRRSGWLSERPPNVSAAWLVAYASLERQSRKSEYHELSARWQALRKELEDQPDFNTISHCGYLDDFPLRLARGLEIRDAWRNVLESEPVTSVLCADDSNAYTFIPLLLAKQRGLPTVSCHHGALDGRYMTKQCRSEVVLAKGKMERDYLTRLCRVPEERVLIGAPRSGPFSNLVGNEVPGAATVSQKPYIVFFSEPYEVTAGRASAVYADILPGLARLATREGRQLLVKLHPSESLAERQAIVERTVTAAQRKNILVTREPLTSDLLDRTWFGTTVLSTVVIDCALRRVPCFLCKWLESSPYGYVDQFTSFGLGVRLNHPEEIERIPSYLQASSKDWTALREQYWQEIHKDKLAELLSSVQKKQAAFRDW